MTWVRAVVFGMCAGFCLGMVANGDLWAATLGAAVVTFLVCAAYEP